MPSRPARATRAARDVYALVSLASQVDADPFNVLTNHTFAAFVHQAADPKTKPVVLPISWLPDDGTIVLFRREKGRNYTLDETYQWCKAGGQAIHALEPVEIRKELFDSAERQRDLLASGRVLYFFFGWYPVKWSLNCTHAVCNLDIADPLGFTSELGVGAARLVLEQFRPWIVGAAPDPAAIKKALRLPRKAVWESKGRRAKPLTPERFLANLVESIGKELG